MTDKDVQLFILRHLEAGNTKADEHILTDVSVEQRRHKFTKALIAIENQGFLFQNYATSDEPKLWNAYVSASGKAFIRENTPEPLIQTIRRTTYRLFDVIVVATVTSIISAIITALVTLYLTGKLAW